MENSFLLFIFWRSCLLMRFWRAYTYLLSIFFLKTLLSIFILSCMWYKIYSMIIVVCVEFAGDRFFCETFFQGVVVACNCGHGFLFSDRFWKQISSTAIYGVHLDKLLCLVVSKKNRSIETYLWSMKNAIKNITFFMKFFVKLAR